jgi:hypothetical protein
MVASYTAHGNDDDWQQQHQRQQQGGGGGINGYEEFTSNHQHRGNASAGQSNFQEHDGEKYEEEDMVGV